MTTLQHNLNTIIIGGSAAGLSCAACLQKADISHIVLEQSEGIGTEWKTRYESTRDRLWQFCL